MSYFEENRKFLALNGVLGRRDFIVNCVLVELIEALFVLTPVLYACIFLSDFRAIILGEATRPLWFMLIQCIVGIVSTALYFPSVVRRIRDIVGEEDDNKIFLISSVISVIIFMGYTPVANSFLGAWVLLFTLLSLIFKAGKITSQKPQSEIIKFNWGAFFGTWVWGLINKVKRPLFILPLLLTIAWVPFMLLCGLKGNEWAYKNNREKFENVDLFHIAQKTQAVFLSILSPIVGFLSVVGITVLLLVSLKAYAKLNPQLPVWFKNYAQQVQIDAAESMFEKIEEDNGVYKFYLEPDDWGEIVTSNLFRQNVMKNAIAYAILKKTDDNYSLKSLLSNLEVVNSVKIYSEFNNEVLAEVNIDPVKASELLEKIDDVSVQKEALKFINDSYKYNQTPSIP